MRNNYWLLNNPFIQIYTILNQIHFCDAGDVKMFKKKSFKCLINNSKMKTWFPIALFTCNSIYISAYNLHLIEICFKLHFKHIKHWIGDI